MVAFPAAAALVSTIFAIQLLTQYAHRKRLPQLAWGIAMTMYAIASLAVAAGVSGGWDPTLFRIYWLFGALLNVPYLALGSVALLRRRPLTALMILVVLAATLIAVVAVASASVRLPAETVRDIPRGSRAWGEDALVGELAAYLSIPAYIIVVLIAFASGRGGRLPVSRIRGNWLIALGATIVAVGSSVARYGRGSLFSVFLAVGVIVMFIGFRLASRAPRRASPTDDESVSRRGPLVLFTSENCGLCEHAKDALVRLGLTYDEVLVPDDHPYRLRTPVLEAGGLVVAEGQIDEGVLRRAVKRSR